MGLLGDSFKAMRMKDPVDGTAQVVGSTMPPDSASSGNVHLTLVLQAEGFPATNVDLDCLAPTKKWPYPGEQLPVTFDRADPERIKVRWDDVPEGRQQAEDQAAALAQMMNQGGGAQSVQSGDPADIVAALQQAMPGANIQVQGGGMPGVGQPPQAGGDDSDDRVAQLERLAKLKDSGALTEQEFEREKARVLGS
jgi:hypothetical protein